MLFQRAYIVYTERTTLGSFTRIIMSLRKIVFGTAIMSSVRMIRLVAQFVAIPILARLLTPEQYGVVAIAMPFALFAMMIADAGIGMSLVRTPISERIQWSTCFWMSVLLGAGLALLMAAAGPVASYVFSEPVLSPMIATLAFVVMAQAILLIPVAALQQAKRFNIIAAIEISATFASICVAVYMAYRNYGAWALIGQQIAFFAVRVVGMCTLSPFRPLFAFSWKEVHEHMSFGRNVLGNSLIQYFSRSFDNWIVGKALGAATVGVYSMAFQFARLPSMILSAPLQYVLYADLAKIKDDIPTIAHTYLTIIQLASILVFPAVGLIAVAHVPVFKFVLSEKWAIAGYIFMILAPACAMQAVTSIGETVLYALGKSQRQMRCSLEFTIIWITGLIIAVRFGVTATALTYTFCVLTYQCRYQRIILRTLGLDELQFIKSLLPQLIATTVAIMLYLALDSMFLLVLWQQLLLSVALLLIVWALCATIYRKSMLYELKQLQKRRHNSQSMQ